MSFNLIRIYGYQRAHFKAILTYVWLFALVVLFIFQLFFVFFLSKWEPMDPGFPANPIGIPQKCLKAFLKHVLTFVVYFCCFSGLLGFIWSHRDRREPYGPFEEPS